MIIEHYPIQYPKINLAIMPRPRAGDWLKEELQSFKRLGYDTIVSLLTIEEETELNLLKEKTEAEIQGLKFYSLPIVDRSIPKDKKQFLNLIDEISCLLREGNSVGVHCRMGIGRAGLTCSAILMNFEESYENAMNIVSKARGLRITDHPSQVDFLRGL